MKKRLRPFFNYQDFPILQACGLKVITVGRARVTRYPVVSDVVQITLYRNAYLPFTFSLLLPSKIIKLEGPRFIGYRSLLWLLDISSHPIAPYLLYVPFISIQRIFQSHHFMISPLDPEHLYNRILPSLPSTIR